MCDSLTQTVFYVFGGLMLCIGAYCSHKFDHTYPCWVRWIVLAPAAVCALLLYFVAQGECIIHPLVTALVVAVALLYALVASRFSKTPWLDIRT